MSRRNPHCSEYTRKTTKVTPEKRDSAMRGRLKIIEFILGVLR